MPPKKAPRKKRYVSKVSYRLPYDQSHRIPYPQQNPNGSTVVGARPYATEEFVKQQFETYLAKLAKDPVTNPLDDYLRQRQTVFSRLTEPKLPITMHQALTAPIDYYHPVEPIQPEPIQTPEPEGDTATTIDKMTTVTPNTDMYGALLESEP